MILKLIIEIMNNRGKCNNVNRYLYERIIAILNLKDYQKRIKRINLFVAILRKLKKYYLQNYCFDSNLIRKRIN